MVGQTVWRPCGQFDILIFNKWTNWYFFLCKFNLIFFFKFWLAMNLHFRRELGFKDVSWLRNHFVTLGQSGLSPGLAFSFCTMTSVQWLSDSLEFWPEGWPPPAHGDESSSLTADHFFPLPCLCATLVYRPVFPPPQQIQQFIPTALSWCVKKML